MRNVFYIQILHMVASMAEKQLSPCKVNTCQLNVHTLSLAVQSVFEIAFKIVQNKEYHDCKGDCYFILFFRLEVSRPQ